MSPGTMTGARRRAVAASLLAVALLTAVIVLLATCHGSAGSGSPAGAGGTASSTTSDTRSVPPAAPPGMATVALAGLPAEARDVVDRLDHGGAFKYRQDGATFGNRESRLPAKPYGYYREYTVTTPGLPDRGPRRIIAGRSGELYYTPDHYRTFQWIVREGSS